MNCLNEFVQTCSRSSTPPSLASAMMRIVSWASSAMPITIRIVIAIVRRLSKHLRNFMKPCMAKHFERKMR